MLTPEQDCLLQLACETWTRRGAAKEVGLAYNEETITESMLLNLKLHYPGDVAIIAFNKAQEAERGADWLWTFVSADEQWSISILVQAKRLDDKEQTYAGINRNIGRQSPPIRQIDRLLDTAQKYGVPAVYAFYNHLGDYRRLGQRCRTPLPDADEQVQSWGISLASGDAVRAALPDETFDRHVQKSIPLHCMLCTRGRGSYGPDGSPASIVQALGRLGAMNAEGLGPDDDRTARRLHPVADLARRMSTGDSEGADDVLAREFPDLAGVIILRDAKRAGAEAVSKPPLEHM